MSLSTDPTFTLLKERFICGYRNISRKRYAGASGKHKADGKAVDTTNGAGPHNLQLFILASDGTVLTCLPGFWQSVDLAKELRLAYELNKIWQAKDLSRQEKDSLFSQMQLAHIHDHGKTEHDRSQMQGFDIQYEAKHKPGSDFFYNPRAVDPVSGKVEPGNLKPVDMVMHQRMATRPFLAYEQFDVAVYSDYGQPLYDKQEQFRDANGNISPKANLARAPMLGNDPRAHPIETQVKHGARQAIMYGIRAAVAH